MAFENILALLGIGAFSIVFLGIMMLGFVEVLGKIYGTFSSLVREDLTTEQRIIYLLLIWFIPFGWVIYLVLGKEKTSELFKEVEFL